MNVLQELQKEIGQMPYGTINITLKRANGRNVQFIKHSYETMRFENNQEGLNFLGQYLKQLIDAKYSGEVAFSVTMKSGELNQMGYHSQKQVNL